MSTSTCCVTLLKEGQPPVVESVNGIIWFRCFYNSCHSGVGYVTVKGGDGSILYQGCPQSSSRKLTWIAFDPSALATGGTIDINYGEGCAAGGHCCNSAKFEFGYVTDQVTPIAIADLDNLPAPPLTPCGPRYNHFSLPSFVLPPPDPGQLVATGVKQVFYYPSDSCTNQPPVVPTQKSCISLLYNPVFRYTSPVGIIPESFQTVTNPFNAIAKVEIIGDVDDDLVVDGVVVSQDYYAGPVNWQGSVAPLGSLRIGVSNAIGPAYYKLLVCFTA